MSAIAEENRRQAFERFMEYVNVAKSATEAEEGLKGKTVIRFNSEGVDHMVETCSTDEIKSFSGKWFRSDPEKRKNNETRNDFKKCLLTFLGIKSFDEIKSEELRKAIEIDNFDGGGHPLSAKRIMAVYNCMNNETRLQFAQELFTQGFSSTELHDLIERRLGVSEKTDNVDGYMNLQPFSDEEKQTLLNDAKNMSQKLYQEALAIFGIPKTREDFIAKMPTEPDEESLKTIEDAYAILEKMEANSTYSPGKINTARGKLIREFYKTRSNEWKNIIKSKVDVLTEKYGDCSQMNESLNTKVNQEIWHELSIVKEDVFHSQEAYEKVLNQICDKFIAKAEAMLKKIDDVNPPFSAAQKKTLRSLVCADPKFRNTNLLQAYSENCDCMKALIAKCQEENPDKKSFMEEYTKTFNVFQTLNDNLNMKIADYSVDDRANTFTHLFKLAYAKIEEETGVPPTVSEKSVALMNEFIAEMKFLDMHADDENTSSMPIAFTRQEAIAAADTNTMFMGLLMKDCYGVEELSSDNPVLKMSDEVASFLTGTDNFGIAERRPLNHPIEKSLDNVYQVKLLSALGFRSIEPRKEADINLATELELLRADLQRTTTGLKLNGNYIARGLEGNGKDIIEKIAENVVNDAVHGKHAIAILSKLLTQNLPGVLQKMTVDFKYPYCLTTLNPCFSMHNSEIVRKDDGSYDILIDYEEKDLNFIDPDDGKIKRLDGSKSGMKYHLNMKLIFGENGAVEVMFNEKPTFSAIFQESPLTEEETGVVENCNDPETGISYGEFVCFDENLLHDPTVKQLAADNDSKALVDYLKDKAISSLDVLNMTKFGLSENFVKVMCKGPKEMPRLTKDLISQLTSAQADVREAAVNELNQICQAYVDRGWLEKVEINPILIDSSSAV